MAIPPADASIMRHPVPTDLMLGSGMNRICIRNPRSREHCIKLPRQARAIAPTRVSQALRTSAAPGGASRCLNEAELAAWNILHRRLGDEIKAVFAELHGIVHTPWGRGLSCTTVLGSSGCPAPRLWDLLHPQASAGNRPAAPSYGLASLCAAVSRLEDWLIRHRVPLFDMNPGNFVVVERDGAPALVCVDMKSVVLNKELLPLSRWIPWLMRAKLRRRAARLRSTIARQLERRSHGGAGDRRQ